MKLCGNLSVLLHLCETHANLLGFTRTTLGFTRTTRGFTRTEFKIQINVNIHSALAHRLLEGKPQIWRKMFGKSSSKAHGKTTYPRGHSLRKLGDL